ncbi:MAG TPA: helix-turn-helix domain-containing protein [Sphingomicrobium sp.]|jgi:transcriptional regulator with XRE-family HTH domain|nr:helix-turn-helix domain-containing protein [Sphingomicrobium sp.]
MVALNSLLAAPPYAVEQAIRRLGADLRTARLRRNLTVKEVAEKLGTGPRAITDAEKGKPTAAIATYAGLLWTYDLLGQLGDVADPLHDREGSALAASHGRTRARHGGGGLSDDF